MTDPTGVSFLSYRRSRLAEASLLIDAQHVLGIPTWQDIENLGVGPTEQQLRDVLASDTTANGILWVTPDVVDSPIIQRVEVPGLLRRVRDNDAFFVVPVAAGGLDYEGAAAVLGGELGLDDLRNWNTLRTSENPIGIHEAKLVAERVLRFRLAAVHSRMPPGDPLLLTLDTWRPPSSQGGAALAVDWSRYFDGRLAKSSDSWGEVLLPALRSMVAAIEHCCPGRCVVATGQASIGAATALGFEFLSPRGLSIEWLQSTPGFASQSWSISTQPETSGFTCAVTYGDASSRELAVLVSVTDDVSGAFGASKQTLPRFRAVLHVAGSNPPPHLITAPGQASDVARIVTEGIRSARREMGDFGRVHLFAAVPVGLAMLIGQKLNTLGSVQTYEFLPGEYPRYQPAALLKR